jgi:hypothetical protein
MALDKYLKHRLLFLIALSWSIFILALFLVKFSEIGEVHDDNTVDYQTIINSFYNNNSYSIELKSCDDILDSPVLLPQELSIRVYLQALKNSVKLVDIAPTKSLVRSVRDCKKKKINVNLDYSQHSLEIVFPNLLTLMYNLSMSHNNLQWSQSNAEKFRIQWTNNFYVNNKYDDDLRLPLFYYLNIVPYRVVFCTFKSKGLENILTGKTKNGIIGEEFYTTNEKIVNLSNPLITDDGKELVDQIITDTIDPTDRGYKNLMRLMMEDGLFKYLPKNDEAWVNFLRPFMKLTRKEKRNTNKN